jgi:hypothetical protein
MAPYRTCFKGLARRVNRGQGPADDGEVNTAIHTQAAGAEPTTEAGGAERRRSLRQPYVIEAYIGTPSDGESRNEVVTLNLSRQGVGFQLPRPLTVGTYHVLEIGLGEQKLVTRVQIKRCQAIPGGFWEVGAEFC